MTHERQLSHGIDREKYDVSLGNLGARLDIYRMENEANVTIVEHTLPGHTLAAPLHRHSCEDEISYVLEGEMTVLADDELTTVPANGSVVKGLGVSSVTTVFERHLSTLDTLSSDPIS